MSGGMCACGCGKATPPAKTTDRRFGTVRGEAIRRGEATYFTGRLCKYGHLAARRVSNGACVACGRGKNRRQQARRIDGRRQRIVAALRWNALLDSELTQEPAVAAAIRQIEAEVPS